MKPLEHATWPYIVVSYISPDRPPEIRYFEDPVVAYDYAAVRCGTGWHAVVIDVRKIEDGPGVKIMEAQ